MTSRNINRKTRILVGQRLLALRTAQGLTQEAAAKKVGIKQSHLSKIERGCGTSLGLLMRLVAVYGSSLDQVVAPEAEKSPAA